MDNLTCLERWSSQWPFTTTHDKHIQYKLVLNLTKVPRVAFLSAQNPMCHLKKNSVAAQRCWTCSSPMVHHTCSPFSLPKGKLSKVTPSEPTSPKRHNTPYCTMENMISIGLTGSHSCRYRVRTLFFLFLSLHYTCHVMWSILFIIDPCRWSCTYWMALRKGLQQYKSWRPTLNNMTHQIHTTLNMV